MSAIDEPALQTVPFDRLSYDHSSTFAAAGRRVACQMLGALLTEALLPSAQISIHCEADGRLAVSIHVRDGDIRYRALARRSFAYGRWMIDEATLSRCEGGHERPCHDPCLLLTDLRSMLPGDETSFARFAEEITQTWVNHSAALVVTSTETARLADLSYDQAEARLTDGHRYHPAFKSRIGFSPRANRAYGPEFAKEIRPIWLAVHSDLASSEAIGRGREQDLLLVASAWGQGDFSSQVVDPSGGRPNAFHYLPVHPWQWENVLEAATAPDRAAGRIVLLERGEACYLAQQSIRTLARVGARTAPSLKLALSIRNSSTARTLAPHTVLNAPRISAWLDQVRSSDPFFGVARTVLLLERMGTSVTLPASSDPAGRIQGAMAAIWRDPIHAYLTQSERAVPASLLTHLDAHGEPAIAAWVRAHGIERWTQALLCVAMLPCIHFLLAHGIALESHQQNMVLLHRDGWPVGVALKDFHDGVRFVPEMLSSPAPALVATPEAHARVNPNSYVEAKDPQDVRDFMFDALFGVNLAELAAFLHLHFGYEERRFWQTAKGLILAHLETYPEARRGADRFELFAPFVAVEDLARRRIDTAPVPPRAAPNPLVAIDGAWSGS